MAKKRPSIFLAQHAKDICTKIFLKASRFPSKHIYIILIAAGLILRLLSYLKNTSLFLDEINIAWGILNRSLHEILLVDVADPTLHIKPSLFILPVKILTMLLGTREYVWRLFPFICSLLSVPTFFVFAKKFLKNSPLALSLAFFVCNPFLIRYAAELNTYSSDVLVVVVLYLSFLRLFLKKISPRRLLRWGIINLAAPWLSYASIVVLLSLNVFLLIRLFLAKNLKHLLFYLNILLLSAFNLRVLSRVSFAPMLESPVFQIDRQLTFFSYDKGLIQTIHATQNLFSGFITETLGLKPAWLFLILILAGMTLVFKRDRKQLFFLAGPILITLAGVFLRLYPATLPRTFLFLAPLSYIFISEALLALLRNRKVKTKMLKCLLVLFVLFSPLQASVDELSRNPYNNREAVYFLKKHYRPGDMIVTSEYGAQTIVVYGYMLNLWQHVPMEPFEFKEKDFSGLYLWRMHQNAYQRGEKTFVDLEKLLLLFDQRYIPLYALHQGRLALPPDADDLLKPETRVWVFLSHYKQRTANCIVSLLRRRGALLKALEGSYASVYLFEMP